MKSDPEDSNLLNDVDVGENWIVVKTKKQKKANKKQGARRYPKDSKDLNVSDVFREHQEIYESEEEVPESPKGLNVSDIAEDIAAGLGIEDTPTQEHPERSKALSISDIAENIAAGLGLEDTTTQEHLEGSVDSDIAKQDTEKDMEEDAEEDMEETTLSSDLSSWEDAKKYMDGAWIQGRSKWHHRSRSTCGRMQGNEFYPIWEEEMMKLERELRWTP